MPPVIPSHVDIDRRDSLKLLSAAMAAALTRCSPPQEQIIPYANMPEGLVAGEPLRFATTLSLSGYGRGFLAISIDGRPIKIEGNPRHPFSLGATDIFAEAEVLSLYDPDRSKIVRQGGEIATWDDFLRAWGNVKPDARFALVTGRVVSPTTLLRVAALKARYPQLRQYRYEVINDDSERAGARLAFGSNWAALPDWQAADVVVSLAADPLGHGPDQLRIARAYAARRSGGDQRQRLYVVEPTWTLTGAAADFRLAAAPALITGLAVEIANRLGAKLDVTPLPDEARSFVQKAGKDLVAAHGRALVLAGPAQPPEVHALCHWINQKLAAPISYSPPADNFEADHGSSLANLVSDLHAGQIDALVIADANPVYDAPDSLGIARAIASSPFSAHLGLYQDETAAVCTWHLPMSHVLESWGDARALDGTASLVQPLIQPLYDTKTRDEVLSFLANETSNKSYNLTRATWRSKTEGDFETWWRQALHDGVIADVRTQLPTAPVARLPDIIHQPAASELTLVLSQHPTVWDGRFANNAWLQECPAPFTKEVWGNALWIAPADAKQLGIADGDTVDITTGGDTVTTPVTIMPGQAKGVMATSWGQGRPKAGRIGNSVGARYLGFGKEPFSRQFEDVRIRKSAKAITFRSTQDHTRLSGRAEELFPIVTLAQLARTEHPKSSPPPSLLAVPPRDEYAWAMVVDTDSCIGCNACVVACQAENNVPVVGPEEISQGRDMHWLRVDVYYQTQGDQERQGFQPVPCMHCELAPCEPVCPVEASVHDHEGLNVQVYNRCIGTRFCEANCPYKVRRFNWYDYAGEQAYADEGSALKAQHNPDVSVRGRGVMEKCNYCLQRVSRARRAAEKEDRPIAEGEMVTACQAACPTRAIHFGDLNRKESDVSRLRAAPQHYTLLAELNTRPRTTFLKRIYGDEEEPT